MHDQEAAAARRAVLGDQEGGEGAAGASRARAQQQRASSRCKRATRCLWAIQSDEDEDELFRVDGLKMAVVVTEVCGQRLQQVINGLRSTTPVLSSTKMAQIKVRWGRLLLLLSRTSSMLKKVGKTVTTIAEEKMGFTMGAQAAAVRRASDAGAADRPRRLVPAERVGGALDGELVFKLSGAPPRRRRRSCASPSTRRCSASKARRLMRRPALAGTARRRSTP